MSLILNKPPPRIAVTYRFVTCRVHDDEEEHAVGIHRSEGAPVAGEERVCIVAAHEEDALEDAGVEAPPGNGSRFYLGTFLNEKCLKYLPAHVINLDAEKETGRDVEGDEEQPEVGVAVEDADDADEDDERQRGEGHVGVGVDVRVPRLVDLEQDEDGDGVHEGRVEL